MHSSKVYRNNVIITHVHFNDKKQYAFGVILDEPQRGCFIPHWIIKEYGLTAHSIGKPFDCLFIEQLDGKDPMIVGILTAELQPKPSIQVGSINGYPESSHAVAKLGDIPGADRVQKAIARTTLTLAGRA